MKRGKDNSGGSGRQYVWQRRVRSLPGSGYGKGIVRHPEPGQALLVRLFMDGITPFNGIGLGVLRSLINLYVSER